MGLFDIFSRKEDDARKATLDELVRQTAAQRTRIREDLAALDARRASIDGWLALHRPAIIADYGRLLDAFLSRDAAAVGRAIVATEDRLPVVAAIPVYYSDGITSVTFAAMATQIFPDHPGLAQRLTAAPGTLPASALTERRMEEFYKPDNTAMDARFLKDPDAVKKMSGNYRENLTLWTDHFRMVLDGLRVNGPAEIARKETALTEHIAAELEKITLAAGRHRALIDAFDRADADGIATILKSLQGFKKIDDMMELGTGRADAEDFTLLALKSFADPAQATRVYRQMVNYGQPLHLNEISARVMGPEKTLPYDALSFALAVATKNKKADAMDLMLSRDAQGTPWLVLAAHDDKLTSAILAPAGDDPALKAAALLNAADMATDTAIAQTLRARADALTVRGAFVTVAPNVRVRPESVDYAGYSDGALRYSVNGDVWHDKMKDVSGKATLRVIAARADMTAISDTSVINGALAMNIWGAKPVISNGKGDKHHISVMTRSNTYGINSTTGDAVTVIERFGARPGWIIAGNEAFNARAIDNAWPVDKEDSKNKIKFLGGGREYYAPVGEAAVEPIFESLIAEDSAIERIGNEIVRMTAVGQARLVRAGDSNRLEIAMPHNGDLHVVLTEEEGLAALKRLESAYGHVFVSPWQTIAPSVIDNLRVLTKNPDNPGLYFNLNGAGHIVPGVEVAQGQKLLAETVRLLPHFHEAVAGKLAINMRRVDAVTLTGEGLKFITRDKTVAGTGNREIFARVVADHGLLPIAEKIAVNPARINLMFYQDGKLTLTSGKGRIALPVTAADATRIMDMVASAAPFKPFTLDAERQLSAVFACTPSWPVVPVAEKPAEELCAPPDYREKPSPR